MRAGTLTPMPPSPEPSWEPCMDATRCRSSGSRNFSVAARRQVTSAFVILARSASGLLMLPNSREVWLLEAMHDRSSQIQGSRPQQA
jgi:hypothetical protein